MKKRHKEQTFGEKLGPVLEEIENAIIEHRDLFHGELASYSNDSFRAAICIFLDIATEKMWEYQDRLDMPYGARETAAKNFMEEFRLLIFRYCDIATEQLFK